MDGCAIIDARRRESTEPGPLWRANATTTGNVQTDAWKSRLHSGNTEQDMRNALVKSFMCDHYSKTMHWAATDRDPARYGIRGRSEYWLHRPSPTFQHRERAFFLLVAEKERKSNGIRPSHHLPRRRRATRRRNGWRGKGNQEPAHQGHQRLRSKAGSMPHRYERLSPSMQPSSKGSRSSESIGAKASDRRSRRSATPGRQTTALS